MAITSKKVKGGKRPLTKKAKAAAAKAAAADAAVEEVKRASIACIGVPTGRKDANGDDIVLDKDGNECVVKFMTDDEKKAQKKAEREAKITREWREALEKKRLEKEEKERKEREAKAEQDRLQEDVLDNLAKMLEANLLEQAKEKVNKEREEKKVKVAANLFLQSEEILMSRFSPYFMDQVLCEESQWQCRQQIEVVA